MIALLGATPLVLGICIVLFLASLVLLAVGWAVLTFAFGMMLDERAALHAIEKWHHEGEEWATGMDAWK